MRTRLRAALGPAGIALLLFMGVLSALELALPGRVKNAYAVVGANLLVALAAAAILFAAGRSPSRRRGERIRICVLVGLIFFLYQEMGGLIHLLVASWFDPMIISYEAAFFGVTPNLWMEQFTSPVLTEIMMFAYLLYTPLVPLVALYVLHRRGPEESERYLLELTVTILACFVCYIAIPVAGPSRSIAPLIGTFQEGFVFTWFARLVAINVHLNGGAFPSAHCAASVVMAAAIWRANRGLGNMFIAVTVLIFISTVYGRFHYVTDTIAGLALALMILAWSDRRHRSVPTAPSGTVDWIATSP